MRRTLFLALTLLLTLGAAVTTPRPAAAACSWECGPCGLICPCGTGCSGPRPFCVCLD
jgi:hypothetical protein